MLQENLFISLKQEFEHKIQFLPDKPDETIESTIKALWLKAAGIPMPVDVALYAELPELTEEQTNILYVFLNQRLENTPLAYITGRQNFMGIELLCDKRALIPRKETEILGNAALEVCRNLAKTKTNPLVLDLCCGSGNLGIALTIIEPTVTTYMSDLSQEAIDLANENIVKWQLMDRVKAMQGNMFEAFSLEIYRNRFNLIVCNPPYISSAKVNTLNPEISANEPGLAFDGGMFGTKIIQQLLNNAPDYLQNEGFLLFEIGLGQGQFIQNLALKTGKYKSVSSITDHSGNIRVIKCGL